MNVFRKILDALSEADVDFVIIGGVAARRTDRHGSPFDLDVCYERSSANLERLTKALRPYHPRLRGAPEGLPFLFDVETIRRGMNFTLTTDLGDLDVLGEIAGIVQHPQVLVFSESVEFLGRPYLVLSLDGLIRSKRTAGRSKDLEALTELEAPENSAGARAETRRLPMLDDGRML